MSEPSAAPSLPRVLKRTLEVIDNLKSIALWSATLIALGAFVALLVREVGETRTVVDPIEVPEALRAKGYSSEVMSTVLIDRIAKMTEVAVDRKERQEVAPGWGTADVVVPTLNISLNATAGLFKSLLGNPNRHVSGEVVAAPGSADRYLLTLRISSGVDGWHVVEPLDGSDPPWAMGEDVKGLIDGPALALLSRIDPLSAASYAYVTDGQKAETANDLGDSHERGRIIEALDRCLEICDQSDRAAAYAIWGGLLAHAAKLRSEPALRVEALAKFEQGEKIGPLMSDALTQWGDLLITAGHDKEGFARYEQAKLRYPRDFRVPYNRAERLVALKRYKEAFDQYQRSVALDPTQEWTFVQWGKALLETGDYDQAEQKFSAAVLLDAGLGPAYRGLAEVLQHRDLRAEAERMLRRANLLDPPSPGAKTVATPPPASLSPQAG